LICNNRFYSLQASSQLPKSSYFKLVDVWLLSSILIIFIIIVFHAIIDRLQDTPKPAIPKHPLSAIIVRPDMTQCKSPLKKRKSNGKKSMQQSRSTSSNKVGAGAVTPTPNSPTPSQKDAHELTTTLSKLGVEPEETTSAEGTAPDTTTNETKNGSSVGQTYREQQPQVRTRKRDSFVAMERADTEESEEDSQEDFSKYTRRRIEWRFWRWSFKDVDKSRTMILTARIVILTVLVIFNILYWSVALGTP